VKILEIIPHAGNPPRVTVNGFLPGTRPRQVVLHKVVHAPFDRVVFILLAVVGRELDGFAAPRTGRGENFTRDITLPGLKGRQLRGYLILVRDAADEDTDLAAFRWP